MWVERLTDEWVATSSSVFSTAWTGFHRISRGPTLMTFFYGSPASGWTRIFEATILNYYMSALQYYCNHDSKNNK